MSTPSLTSSVTTASVSTAVLVATAGPITVVITLEASTAAAAPEPTLPVVKAFFRGWASLAALLIVLLQQSFSLFALQLSVRHCLQEVASLRKSKVGLESDSGDHRRRRERDSPSSKGRMEKKRERERGRGL